MKQKRIISRVKQASKKISLMILSILFAGSIHAQSKTWVAPASAVAVKNPLAGNTETLKYAKVIYVTYCTPCHGTKGYGDGPAAAGLNTKPANHSSDVVQKETDGTLFWKISEGRNPMPSYKTVLTENQRWELVNYIRTLAKVPKK
jgi:mono/diheme cytochrome c family protein